MMILFTERGSADRQMKWRLAFRHCRWPLSLVQPRKSGQLEIEKMHEDGSGGWRSLPSGFSEDPVR